MLVVSRLWQRLQRIFAGHSRSCWGSARLGRSPVSAMPLVPASHPDCPFLLLHSKVIVGCCALVIGSAGRGLLKGVFPVFEGSGCLFQTLELSHTSCFLLPFSSLTSCDIVTGLPPDLWASLCLFKLRIPSPETSPCVYICTSQWSKFR